MPSLKHCRKDLLDIYQHALDAVKPDRIVRNAVQIHSDAITVKTATSVHKITDLRSRRLHLIGGGKSVLAMACGIGELALSSGHVDLFSHGALSLPVGLKYTLDRDTHSQKLLSAVSAKCFFGSKDNTPDADSVTASQCILDSIQAACAEDKHENKGSLFVVLLSGGGSACLTSPRLIDLQRKRDLINHLVKNGANIVELNQVRLYFSNLKAGGLAREILLNNPKAEILSLIISDVVGDPLEYIASGPTCVPKLSDNFKRVQDMLNVLEKFNFDVSKLPVEPDEQAAQGVTQASGQISNYVIGSNTTALETALARARALDYETVYLGGGVQGSTSELVKYLIESGDQRYRGKKLIVLAGGETTVTKLPSESWGKGGRLQEAALDYVIRKFETSREDSPEPRAHDLFFGGSTDGQDGPTDIAACITSFSDLEPASLDCLIKEARNAKSKHDAYHFWNEYLPDALIRTGLTGTNVMDLYMYLIADKN